MKFYELTKRSYRSAEDELFATWRSALVNRRRITTYFERCIKANWKATVV
jgi:hypothetical protein